MKKYLDHPLFHLKHETYLTLITILAPMLYFLAGINIDIYSPSMPSIAHYFHATVEATKNTISMSVLGWSLGGLIFGILIDSIGRKKVLVIGMLFYVIFSMMAPFSKTIHTLMLFRFAQGFFLSSIIGARVAIMDLISGRRFTIAILYTSVGWGLGPILGPFVGGLLQYYFDWQANFAALVIWSFLLLFLVVAFVKETIPVRHPLHFMHVARRCFEVFTHKKFMAGVFIGAVTQVQLMLYPTVGPFIVEKELHQSVLVYGNSALIVGSAYLIGNLFNRALLKYFSPRIICHIGFIVLLMSLLLAYFFSLILKMELTTVMLPIILTAVSAGFIYPNVLGANLKQFAHSAGIAMAAQSGILLGLASVGLFLVSHVSIDGLFKLFVILVVMGFLEIAVFYGYFQSILVEEKNVKNV